MQRTEGLPSVTDDVVLITRLFVRQRTGHTHTHMGGSSTGKWWFVRNLMPVDVTIVSRNSVLQLAVAKVSKMFYEKFSSACLACVQHANSTHHAYMLSRSFSFFHPLSVGLPVSLQVVDFMTFHFAPARRERISGFKVNMFFHKLLCKITKR